MRNKPILVRAVRAPVPTFRRMPSRYERTHRDRQQLHMGLVLVLAPIAWVFWVVA